MADVIEQLKNRRTIDGSLIFCEMLESTLDRAIAEITELRAMVAENKFAYFHDEEKEFMRPVLYMFAEQMEAKLKKNDHKKGWRELPIEALFKLLMVELEEFKIAHEFFGVEDARRELVDIANYCMILHDRLGMEEDKNNGRTK